MPLECIALTIGFSFVQLNLHFEQLKTTIGPVLIKTITHAKVEIICS